MDVQKIKISGEGRVLDVLDAYLHRLGLAAACDLVRDDMPRKRILVCAQEDRSFEYPVRLGKVLDYINISCKRHQEKQGLLLPLGQGILDIGHGMFIREGAQVKLTEKEVEILLYLHGQEGRTVSRADLLNEVWGYGQGIETHTLETHIYRLRQKIESDPSAPLILITEDNGYRVCL